METGRESRFSRKKTGDPRKFGLMGRYSRSKKTLSADQSYIMHVGHEYLQYFTSVRGGGGGGLCDQLHSTGDFHFGLPSLILG